MSLPLFRQTQFLLSAANIQQLAPDSGCEVAFVGRSNAGKSSAINSITGCKGLAKISKTPGRTQCINLFTITAEKRLADLPGYGYAAVAADVKARWQTTLAQYLRYRLSLRGLILVMDIRHPWKEVDQQLVELAVQASLPTHILLTKADKLSRSQAQQTLKKLQTELNQLFPQTTLQLFSAKEGMGIEEVSRKISEWLK